jgi:hypothetical protein
VTNQYADLINACQAENDNQWAIGDALIDIAGKSTRSSRRDGSRDKIKAAAQALTAAGVHEYAAKTLITIRRITSVFSDAAARYRAGYVYTVCAEAGGPRTLQAVIDENPDVPITAALVRETKKEWKRKPELTFGSAVERVLYKTVEKVQGFTAELPEALPQTEIDQIVPAAKAALKALNEFLVKVNAQNSRVPLNVVEMKSAAA